MTRATHPPACPSALLAAALLVCAAAPTPATGQTLLGPPAVRPSLVEQSDQALGRGQAAEALRILEEPIARGATDYRILWRAARAALALAVEAESDPSVRDPLAERAIALGDAAVAAQPAGPNGRFWRVAAKGRVALHSGPRRTVSLARQVLEEAQELLAMDPRHAGAHNAVGRLNLEVMILPGWKRALAKLLAGSELRKTSWELAELHLRLAVELEPDNILYQRDLGALHRHRERPMEARATLSRALTLDAKGPWERAFQEEARAILAEIETEAAPAAPGERR